MENIYIVLFSVMILLVVISTFYIRSRKPKNESIEEETTQSQVLEKNLSQLTDEERKARVEKVDKLLEEILEARTNPDYFKK